MNSNSKESRSQVNPTKTADPAWSDPPVILFDGVCNLCNASVNFVIDRDPKGVFRFAPLQSETGQRLLRDRGFDDPSLSTIILIEDDRIYRRSAAALRIARRLSWPWPLLSVFLVVPRFIRDGIYRWVARNRYRWFGKSQECRIPTPELRDRFLEGLDRGV